MRMKKPKDGWKLGRDSQSVLRIKFMDGNKRSFYSRDWKHKSADFSSRELGLTRLRALIKQFGEKGMAAAIFDLISGNKLEQYLFGRKKEK